MRRNWRAERVGWAGLSVVILLGVCGFLGGDGLFGVVRDGSVRGDLRVEYRRFVRAAAETQLRLELTPPEDASDVSLFLSSGVTDCAQILAIVPRPLAERAGPDGLRMRIGVAEPGAPIVVQVTLRMNAYGRVRGAVGVAGAPGVEIRQFAFP